MDAQTPAGGTPLGSLEITLLGEPGTSTYSTSTQLRTAADKVAREVPLVVGSLLFAQRQVRSINDPARVSAVDEISRACTAAREYRLVARAPAPNSRVAATYRIDLVANGGFRINVEQRLEGLLQDTAGAITIGAQANELLATLNEPYRTFHREMLEAALVYWRDRRPSNVESTWIWPVALRRLDYLVRNGVPGAGVPQRCGTCQAYRPVGSACLHCGAEGGASTTVPAASPPAPATAPPTTSAPPPWEARGPVAPPAAPTVPTPPPAAPPPVAEPVRPSESAPVQAPPAPERTIVAAQERPPTVQVEEPDVRQSWPLASLPRRAGAWVIDVVVAAILGLIGGFGLTSIALASNWLGPDESPGSFFAVVAAVVIGLYFVFGWTTSETAGMLVFRLGLLRLADRKPVGLFRAIARAIGYALALVVGLVIFFGGNFLDNYLLVSIPTGTPADTAIRIAVGLIALYLVWLLTGQRIVSGGARQTIGDQFASAVVARKV
jgi:RDD family